MTWTLTIENIAGIRKATATLDEGVNAVRASNWQGKSSFLAAVKAGLGVGKPLMEGASKGNVTIDTDSTRASVTLRRTDSGVVRNGSPLLNDDYDRVRVELFSALDEMNPIRQAVRNGDDLKELLTRPLDIADIDETIAATKSRRNSIEAELKRANEAADRIPSVRERINDLESKRNSLEQTREEISSDGPTVDRRNDLSSLRAERKRVENRIDRLTSTIERIDEKIKTNRSELEEIEVKDPGHIESELSDVRSEYESVKRESDLVRELYTANKRFYEADTRIDIVQHNIVGESVECWVCGEEIQRDTIEDHLAELKEEVETLQQEVRTHEDEIDELESERDAIRSKQTRKQNRKEVIADLKRRREERQESLESARSDLAEITSDLDELEEVVEDKTADLTEVESELKYTGAELSDLREELSSLEDEAERRDQLQEQKEDLTAEIENLRTRKGRIRRQTRDSFRNHITELIDRFETGFETARLTDSFEIVVARDGREASLTALSQGERELLGIIAGIAGYEAFEMAADIPVLLLDNLGVLTDRNVEILIDHLRNRAEYLVFTSYPEHTAFAGNEIDVSDWSVISGDETVQED